MKPVAFTGLRAATAQRDMPPVSFELRCRCGNVLRGQRSTQAQFIRCPQCQAERLVLPRSPLPAINSSAIEAAKARPTLWSFWRWPALAIAVTAVLAAAFIYGLLHYTRPQLRTAATLTPEQRFEQHRNAGEEALHTGSYERAAHELQQALALRSEAGFGPNAPALVKLKQQQREAAILADLLSESLDEIIRRAVGMPDDEWQQVFRKRYAQKSVILDDVIHRDPYSRHHHRFQIDVLGKSGRIELDRLSMMLHLPLQQPRRLFFGFRLSSIHREADGSWRITPEADSGVLLTDGKALAGLSLAIDAELADVITQQHQWLEREIGRRD